VRFFPAMVVVAVFAIGLAAQPALAQQVRWKSREARIEYAAQQGKSGAGESRKNFEPIPNPGKGQPNARGMEGLPPKWVENLRDLPPEDQERFMRNNERFQSLPPERQEQIRKNLQNWNRLTPEQKEEMQRGAAALERMTPEQRQYVRNTLLPKWQQMPQDRRQVINRHLAMLRAMSPATQEAALNDPRFLRNLSPDEQSMLRDLNSLRNPPAQ